jgi:hypothetical protein
LLQNDVQSLNNLVQKDVQSLDVLLQRDVKSRISSFKGICAVL